MKSPSDEIAHLKATIEDLKAKARPDGPDTTTKTAVGGDDDKRLLDPSPNITYDNQTGYLLCAVSSGRGPPKATPERCDEIEPNERQSYLTGVCSGDDPLWILMTVGPGGEEIYGPKLATCEEWDGATVTIQLRGDEFVVTDSLPDNTPSP